MLNISCKNSLKVTVIHCNLLKILLYVPLLGQTDENMPCSFTRKDIRIQQKLIYFFDAKTAVSTIPILLCQ